MNALEFYSGIGGMHYSLKRVCEDSHVMAAFDMNPSANQVYEHNFGIRPKQKNISSLSIEDLNKYQADIWLLSPPCQPYTRQGLQLGSEDARAESFLNLLTKLDELQYKPQFLLIENVVGFETSETRKCLLEALERNGFVTQEYILSPIDLGIPYSRPRYFCLAKTLALNFKNPSNNGRICSGTPCIEDHGIPLSLGDFLEQDEISHGKIADEPSSHDSSDSDIWHKYWMNPAVVEKYISAIDIVTPSSRRCCCFTKSYFRYAKGTGSVIAMNAVPLDAQNEKDTFFLDEDMKVHVPISKENGNIDKADMGVAKHLKIRYFTPREIANLHSFPPSFDFPEDVTIKQRYALLGNSLSVAVVECLLLYLFDNT